MSSHVIFVIRRWEDHEGGDNLGVFSTIDKAKDFVAKYIDMQKHDRRSKIWEQEDEMNWNSGIDNIEIQTWKVDDETL